MTRSRTFAWFNVGEIAPTPFEALDGIYVVNDLGNTALQGFSVDPRRSSRSEVRIDETSDFPQLIIKEALTKYITGVWDPIAEEFGPNGVYEAPAIVSGVYGGAGSRLKVY